MNKIKNIFIILFCIAIVFVICILGINEYVKKVGEKNIITPEEAIYIEGADCAVVLGCFVNDNGVPSSMLNDRIKRGVYLYEQGVVPKIIMSGDHGRTDYDEVNTMKKIAVSSGVPSEDVFMDHAGFSTYESMYRAKEIFKAKKIIIVSQEYHLHRAIYIAEKLGLEAYGVNSDYYIYTKQAYRDAREILARCKDFIKTIFKPEPTFLGEAIPVSGDGNLTND